MTIEHPRADKESISRFILAITCDWPNSPEQVGLFEIRCLGEDQAPRSQTFTLNATDESVDFAMRMNAKKLNVYMTINPIGMDAKIKTGKGAKDKDILRAHYSFADADNEQGIRGLNKLRDRIEPDLIITTGLIPNERCHNYYRFNEPCTDLKLWEARQKNIAIQFDTDQCVVNPSRIMRVAGTVSYPSRAKQGRGYVPELVTLEQSNSSTQINRIEDWDDIIGPLNMGSQNSDKSSGKLDRSAASNAALKGYQWHNNMRSLVASFVAKGQTDADIQAIAADHTLAEYTVEQTQHELQKMIDGARQKGFAKSGEIHQQNSYIFFKNQIYLSKFVRSEQVEIKLTNFDAAIIYETTITNGIDNSKAFTVEGALHNGTPLTTFNVEANAFDKLEWLPTNWGAKAQVTVGTMYKAHVAAAIKERSNPTERIVYSHTGWIEKNGKFHYLTNRGGINAAGLNEDIETELQGSLADYDLPAPNENYTEKLSDILQRFLNVMDDGTALLLVGAAFRATLSHFEKCTVSVFLQGTTGTYKTATSGCVQAFFGKEFNGSHLPENWSSTGNAMEKKAFLCKDALFTIDDFVARGTPSEVSRLHRDAERVLRAQGNQSGRDRLTSTTEVRGAYIPQGLILATGEDIPNGHSLQARCVILSIKKGATNTDTLTALQELAEQESLAQLMSNFLSWGADQADQNKIKGLISAAHDDCIKELPTSGHTRMRDNLTSLMSGIWLLLQFGKERGDISDGEIAKFKTATLNAATKVAELQMSVDREASDADRFIEFLRSSLAMGAAHLVNERGHYPSDHHNWGWKVTGSLQHEKIEGQGPKIGWTFNGKIHLDMKAALSVIKTFSTRLGNHLGSSERAISKALFEAGMLAKHDKGRHTAKVSVEGRRENVICLPVSLVMDIQEIEKEPSEDDTPLEGNSPF
jgi:hypothetical protein